jgi:hypothetical protein
MVSVDSKRKGRNRVILGRTFIPQAARSSLLLHPKLRHFAPRLGIGRWFFAQRVRCDRDDPFAPCLRLLHLLGGATANA